MLVSFKEAAPGIRLSDSTPDYRKGENNILSLCVSQRRNKQFMVKFVCQKCSVEPLHIFRLLDSESIQPLDISQPGVAFVGEACSFWR